MEQRRRQPVWKAESRRKREKRIARLRRRIIAYTVRGIVAAVLAVMLLLMVCGCLLQFCISGIFFAKIIRILLLRQIPFGKPYPAWKKINRTRNFQSRKNIR